jgi:hypothetical protein
MNIERQLWEIAIKVKRQLKYQRDKMLECLEHYWIYLDATTLQDTMIEDENDILPGKQAAFYELGETYMDEWNKFEKLADEIRQEMEGQNG